MIIDSCACASLMPTGWCEHVPLKETAQSQAGECFRAANGQNMHNHGEKVVSLITNEGAKRDMEFIVCDVSNINEGEDCKYNRVQSNSSLGDGHLPHA